MIEILAPAGNMECAEAAINNGADAIYLGLNAFSARQSAANFDADAFRALLQKAHFCGVKVYVAMNTIVKEKELDAFIETLLFAWNEGADAIIMQDALLGKRIHQKYPEIILHLSTQAGVCNIQSAKFAQDCGFTRVILARETPLEEIREIAQLIETEVFIQGALCTAFSGQCYFSSFAGGNSGNRGRCKQPCRKLYSYNRNENTEKNYALSLSDLCVGESIEKLIEAGVVSFKIEGRMRRAEYVAAAVRYYRSLFINEQSEQALSDLKRAYNRGNYTKGLAFGQDKRLLSTAIQGHLGEKIGVVKVFNVKYLVESAFKPSQGDSFKILRDGKELGGATFCKTEGKAFSLFSKLRLKNGDGVFITTDTRMNERVLRAEKKGRLHVELLFKEGELPIAKTSDVYVVGRSYLQSAQNRPLTEKELKDCFLKSDGLPIEIDFDRIEIVGNIFIPKSELNAFRREFYETVCAFVAKGNRKAYEYTPFEKPILTGKNDKIAVISNDFDGIEVDVAIYKATDLRAALPNSFKNGEFEKYIYFPPFATNADIAAIENLLIQANFDGVYAENYGGIEFARAHRLKIFTGTGLNLINRQTIAELLSLPSVAYYAISKEANYGECTVLTSEKAFVLSSGNIKLMDLCYCPFGKSCKICDQRDVYTLTDENNREFPVKRNLSANGSCRFEVYNCADLIGVGVQNAGSLMDLTVTKEKSAAAKAVRSEEAQKKVYHNYTSGHFKRGVL
ncbi:MAG: U32 family peptidase [Clostridia bacterium]|nr:U32 family peptidase [Clostridia bacterium]